MLLAFPFHPLHLQTYVTHDLVKWQTQTWLERCRRRWDSFSSKSCAISVALFVAHCNKRILRSNLADNDLNGTLEALGTSAVLKEL